MKLALVSPYDFAYPGGVTEHVSNLAEQFVAAGHQVHIVAPSSDDETEPIVSLDAPIHRIGRVVSIPANGSVARICAWEERCNGRMKGSRTPLSFCHRAASRKLTNNICRKVDSRLRPA